MPSSHLIDPVHQEQVLQTLHAALAEPIFPNIELLFARGEEILFHFSSPQAPGALFDLASLTKPLATAMAVLKLQEFGILRLDHTVYRYLPELPADKREITLHQLLTHTSGLPAWEALYEPHFDRKIAWQRLINLPLDHPVGSKMVYSCMGYLLLGELVRRVSGESLEQFCKSQFYQPLGLSSTLFNPDPTKHTILPTDYCPYRKIQLCGQVHDENAALFGGEGGNAGLFSNAMEIHRLCLHLWKNPERRSSELPLSWKSLEAMWHNAIPGIGSHTIGWDLNPSEAPYKSCGQFMPVGSIGHLGFTGTSLWLDPASGLHIIVLTNRVNLGRETKMDAMRAFRPVIHDLLLSMINPALN